MSKKMLITGGCGFIGHHFVEHFLKNTDWEIIILDKLTYAASGFDRIRDINAFDDKRVFIYSNDISTPISEGVLQEIKSVNYILHMAAESVSENTIIPTYRSGRNVQHFRIKDLWELYEKKYNKCVDKRGVEIIDISDPQEKTLTIKSGYGQWRRIKQITRHWYEGKVVNMKQKWGEITVTPNHSIYNSNMELTIPSKEEELLPLRKIKPFRNQLNVIEHFGKFKWKTSMDDLIYLIAFFVTEGSTTFNKANGSYITDFSQNNIEDIYRIYNIVKDNFGIDGYICERKCSSLRINSKEIYNFFRKLFGTNSGNKKLPEFVFKLNDELKFKLWEYMVYFDGTKYDQKKSRYCSNSEILISQICTLLSMINIDYSYNRKVFDKEEWNDSITINQCYVHNNNKDSSEYEEFYYKGWVYDIEVDDTHKFTCGLGNIVVHNSHVDKSIEDPYPFIVSNIIGTYNMLEFARKMDNLELFLYFSTDEVFGPAPNGVFYKEWDRYNCTNAYSATKAGANELCMSYSTMYGLPVVVTNTMNAMGERQHPEKFIPMTLKKILNGEKVIIHSDPTGTISGSRHYIHCRNIADGVQFLLSNFEEREKYNIVGEKEVTNLELAQMIADIAGKPLHYEMVDFHSSRPGHDLRYALDGSKMKELGWEPPKSFEKSLEKTINWTLKNKKWL